MAKKKINIILIIVVLGLWGTVGFRTINRYFGNSDVNLSPEAHNSDISLKKVNKDTFELKKIGRDPFLNKQFVEKPAFVASVSYHAPVRKAIKPSPAIPKPKFDMPWPQLQYFGYLKSNDIELVLLKIDSKLHKLKLNDEVNGLTIKKKFKDSIEVVFNSQSKIIHAKKN
ncbi:hypothetical protein [Flavobacterium tistrianum]|uniref:hypothetical protein n=1 Tax=Flavobacterium tistrianum TaxID=1685414 RepID=UPI000DAD54C2|nr:hypothetical protein [Flavobacterium tistrianum]KAF2342588.1 hypothetical protein DMB71_02750 [Flavobacterium tistrianum]